MSAPEADRRLGLALAAVTLVALVLRDTLTVLLTQRTEHLSDHPGQISFPGGRVEPGDVDATATALREAHEEQCLVIFLEVRDSTTGAILGRALDRRNTRNTGRVQISNSVTNLSDFRALFKQWSCQSCHLEVDSDTGSNLKRGLPVVLPCEACYRHVRPHADGAAATDDRGVAEMLRRLPKAFLRNEAK